MNCAYCGKKLTKRDKDREHVFPKGLYPPSKVGSKVQLLTIPSCRNCNNSWADDEAHFRNVLAIAGEPNTVRRELWGTKVLRSYHEIDGLRRARDIVDRLKPVKTDNDIRYMVFPGEDERVIRVIKKIIKGLCFYHHILTPVLDSRIWVDVLKYVIVPGFLDQMSHHHREQDIVEYRYQVLNEHGISSVWLITFFERVPFIGLVSESKNGFI